MSGGQWLLIIGICAFVIIGIDLWVRLFKGEEPMLSMYIRRWNQWWPMCGVSFGLVIGTLLGHFFWCDCSPPAPPVFQVLPQRLESPKVPTLVTSEPAFPPEPPKVWRSVMMPPSYPVHCAE